jgi:prolyl 4-hydroxylase
MPQPRIQPIGDVGYTVEGLVSEPECEDFITRGRRQGFELAPLTLPTGPRVVEDVRNNGRATFFDVGLAVRLAHRVRDALPPRIGDWRLLGLNEFFRLYRYRPGEYFRWHRDGAFVRSPDERSLLSWLLYLNDGFEGGQTQFSGDVEVRPRPGLILVFAHGALHQGAPVTAGTKYVLRSDVMFRRHPTTPRPRLEDAT